MKKYFLEYITSYIYEDDYEEGEGKHTGCGLDITHIGRFFETKAEMISWLYSHYGLSDDISDYDTDNAERWATDRLVADHSNVQNGGWFEPTERELVQWRCGELKLYVEHYWIQFHRA